MCVVGVCQCCPLGEAGRIGREGVGGGAFSCWCLCCWWRALGRGIVVEKGENHSPHARMGIVIIAGQRY